MLWEGEHILISLKRKLNPREVKSFTKGQKVSRIKLPPHPSLYHTADCTGSTLKEAGLNPVLIWDAASPKVDEGRRENLQSGKVRGQGLSAGLVTALIGFCLLVFLCVFFLVVLL